MYFGRLEFWRRRLEITTLAELGWKYCERVFWGEDVCGWNFWNWLLGNGGLMRMSRREGGKIDLIYCIYYFFFRNKGLMENGKLMKLSKNWLFIFREGEREGGNYDRRLLLKFRSQFCDISWKFWRASKFDKRKINESIEIFCILRLTSDIT